MKKQTIILAGLLLLAACNRTPRVHQIKNLGGTPYQEDTIRMTYARNPERALALLDSAILLGNIDPYHALLARATIYSRSPESRRLDQAETLCRSLLQHDSVVGVPQRQSAVLDLLIYTSNMKDDNEAYIRWASQKAELCREMGDEVEALRTRAEIGAAMAALPGILRAQQAPGVAAGRYYRANETVRVACVGYSDRFRSSLLPCFLHHNKELNFDMVAVADLWRKRLVEDAVPGIEKKIGHKIASYKSDVDLYENAKDVDAVIISTADFQHAQHACHAVVAGKDAYCEKPLAEDMYSANMLKDAVDAKRNAGFAPGSVLQIGSQRRSGKKYMAAKEFINAGKFGDISYVDLRWNVNQPKRWRRPEALIASLKEEDVDWKMWLLDRDPSKYPFDPRKYLEFRLFWPFSSGTPGQWMCHQIDTVAWFMGYPYPKSAVSSGGLYQWVDGRQSFDTFTTTRSRP